MVRVGLTVVHRDVRWRPEMPRVGGSPDRCPECLGANVIHGGAPAPILRSVGLSLSMMPSLDGAREDFKEKARASAPIEAWCH